jgi:hypothetical protein
MNRFSPSRVYPLAALAGLLMAGFSAWCAWSWWPAWIPTVMLLVGAVGAGWLATRPRIKVNGNSLVVGRQAIDWSSIRRVDQTNWISPLVVHLALVEGRTVRVLYPGHADQCRLLLRLIQQRCTHALINGVPHSRIFGETPQPKAEKAAPAPPRILSDEDAAEVERMFQILRSAGRLDSDDK